ncbi:hypothetical protein [Clostridium massiliamazoniense]|uniref:hypothetical protein n=1 Tax=Clostridium massiliamazoniense TaxID=1347366 RepID=UPI0006D7631A|nr:hypothetical protein [Clostridium massiliamazoniense]
MDKNIKRQISEWSLNDYKDVYNNSIDLIDDTIEQCFQTIHNFIDIKQKIEVENSMLDFREVENVGKDLITIVDYVEDEFVIFESKIFPINYYKVESFRYYTSEKNLIINAVSEKLKEINFKEKGFVVNNWDESLLLFQLKKIGKVADFDNYFCKPFVDGIRNSRFIKDDSSNNLTISYSNLNSEQQLLRATLINKKHKEKYKEKILDIILN